MGRAAVEVKAAQPRRSITDPEYRRRASAPDSFPHNLPFDTRYSHTLIFDTRYSHTLILYMILWANTSGI
jgi:hypothetical protein